MTSWAEAQRYAVRRRVPFELSREEFVAARGTACTYCEGPLPSRAIGLDRLDERLGYVAGNVVGCCWYCNTRRLTMALTPAEMRQVWAIHRERFGPTQWPGPVPGTQRWSATGRTLTRQLFVIAREVSAARTKPVWLLLPDDSGGPARMQLVQPGATSTSGG